MVSMASAREQIVQRYDIGENTAVFILFQAEGCDQSVVDRIFRRNHFSDPFWSAEQYPIVVLVNSEVVACKFDLAHIDHIIIPYPEVPKNYKNDPAVPLTFRFHSYPLVKDRHA